ncbi:MAG: dihydroneopterin aldolase [Calditrichota bacterium]
MDAVRLKNMLFFAYHGARRSEAENGQRFEVDVELRGSLKIAGLSDDLRDTFDYDRIFSAVSETMTNARFNLMEAVAEEISRRILVLYPHAQVRVVLRKPHAPVTGGVLDGAEIEIQRGPVQDHAGGG